MAIVMFSFVIQSSVCYRSTCKTGLQASTWHLLFSLAHLRAHEVVRYLMIVHLEKARRVIQNIECHLYVDELCFCCVLHACIDMMDLGTLRDSLCIIFEYVEIDDALPDLLSTVWNQLILRIVV